MQDEEVLFTAKVMRLVPKSCQVDEVDKWRSDPNHHVTLNLKLRLGLDIAQVDEQKVLNLWPMVVSSKRDTVVGAVVTGFDSNIEDWGMLLARSLTETTECELWVADLGMSDNARNYLRSLGAFVYSVPTEEGVNKSWFKARMIRMCPTVLNRLLWIDADAIALRSVAPLFDAIDRAPLLLHCYCSELGPNWREVTLNNPNLYEGEVVKWRWPLMSDVRINAGVLGLNRDRDSKLFNEWDSICERAIADPDNRSQFTYWDQGAMILAMERLGMTDACIVPNRDWNDTRTRWESKSESETIQRLSTGTSRIFHCAGAPKIPAKFFEFREIQRPPVTVYVLGHRDDQLGSIGNRPWIQKVDLRTIGTDVTRELAESLIYLQDLHPSTDYVGLATASWNTKYKTTAIDTCLDKLEYRKDLVWAPAPAPSNYQEHLRRFHADSDWAQSIVEGVAGFKAKGPTLWSNNFICHRDRFEELVAWMRLKLPLLIERFGWKNERYNVPDTNRRIAYVAEELAMLWWSNQDIEIREITPAVYS